MQHTEGTFTASDGATLFTQSWQPDVEPLATLVIVHGYGEHSGRYANVVNRLVPEGFALHSFDLRGHGRSPGQRGYINSWADYRDDVGVFLQLTARNTPGLRLFLYGHSMGSLIVLDYALHRPDGLAGVIASAPSLGKLGIPAPLLALSRAISKVWPTFAMKSGLDAAQISRDHAVVDAYRADPLVHDTGSARLGSEIGVAQDWAQAHAADLHLPLLVIQGGADAITAPADTQRFYQYAGSTDKCLLLFEDAYHEVHNDIGCEQALQQMSAWLHAHLNGHVAA